MKKLCKLDNSNSVNQQLRIIAGKNKKKVQKLCSSNKILGTTVVRV